VNWLPHEVSAPPAGEPVSLAELRVHVSLEADDESFDTELGIYLKAATSDVEERTGTKLIAQTVVMRADCFRALRRLPVAPLLAIDSIAYLDPNGVEQTLDPSVYEPVLTGLHPLIRLKPSRAWPGTYCAPDAIRVTATAGYGEDATTVPHDIRAAILLLAADLFLNREDGEVGGDSIIPTRVRALLRNHRTF